MVIILTFNINKKIKVGVVFKETSGQMVPRWFIREGRQYNVNRITYTWDEKQGKSLIRHFAVMVDNTCYELTYNTDRMLWHLASVDDEN